MGNTSSTHFEEDPEDVWWTPGQPETPGRAEETEDELERRRNLEDREIAKLAEKRKQILAEKREEFKQLREEIRRLKTENEELRKNGGIKNSDVMPRGQEDHDATMMRLEIGSLNEKVQELEKEKDDYRTLVVALKNVNKVAKQMLQIRESQIKELTSKLTDIENLIAKQREQQDLRGEYERQLTNIKNLKVYYEERHRIETKEKEEALANLEIVTKDLKSEKTKNRDLNERIAALEETDSKKYDEIKHLESDLGLAKAESRQLESELTIINQLFSDVLVSVNTSQDMNLDKLQRYLEEHHDLLQSIVNEMSSEDQSAMPKALLDLVSQIGESEKGGEEAVGEDDRLNIAAEETTEETPDNPQQMNSPEQIVKKLPKVWRILIELLSHQTSPVNNLTDIDDEDSCYKTVQTAKGPNLVLSVSQTYIRLTKLILEKRSLEKETGHLRQLNGHLENRMQEQEKRLELVQSEVAKTWHLVGKLQKQHQLLHTQEKVLRYELAQKRKLLTELKQELEISREKWAEARQKNTSTEEQWKLLRNEFASRKGRGKTAPAATVVDAFEDSTESGFSDEKDCSSESDETE